MDDEEPTEVCTIHARRKQNRSMWPYDLDALAKCIAVVPETEFAVRSFKRIPPKCNIAEVSSIPLAWDLLVQILIVLEMTYTSMSSVALILHTNTPRMRSNNRHAIR
jgi:hypothetical protein